MTDQPPPAKPSSKYRPDGSRVPKSEQVAATAASARANTARVDARGGTPLNEAREAGLSRVAWEQMAQDGLWP